MTGAWMFIIIPVVISLAIAAAIYSHQQQKKRREEMAALASQLGWSFDSSNDPTHDEHFAQFEIFRRGHSRAAYNTLIGSLSIDGRDFSARMGDYTYKITSSNGKTTTTTTYRFSYLILHMPFPSAPDLLIRREGIFDKIAGAFGFDDIDFESAEFSKKFYVKSADKRFAYDVVHPGMMEFLLASDPTGIDIESGQCCVSDGRRVWTTLEFQSHLRWLREFFDLWPEHLTAEFKER